MISVVMATFNGERFIEKQLESICRQTFLPDEIIIRDDKSTDSTLEIVSKVKKKYKNIRWKIIENAENVGYKKNFYKALTDASGDYIFLADQDDIWLNFKIEKMIEIINGDDSIWLLMSNLKSFYEEECKNRIKSEKFVSFNKVIRLNKLNHIVNTPRPGCSFCINRKLLDLYKTKIDFKVPHDNLMWQIASLESHAYLYNEITMLYRRHSSNASNNKKNTLNKRITAIQTQINDIERILKYNLSERQKKFLSKQKDVFKLRKKYIEERNILNLFLQIRYLKYYYTMRIFWVDIYYLIKFFNEGRM